MRHLAAVAAGLACLLASAVLLDRLAARSPAPGVAWVVTRGPVAEVLDAALAGQDTRLLQAWAGGRVLQLHAQAIGALSLAPDSSWLLLRLPGTVLAWPGCS